MSKGSRERALYTSVRELLKRIFPEEDPMEKVILAVKEAEDEEAKQSRSSHGDSEIP